MAQLKQGVAYTRSFLMVQSADHLTPLTGATVTVLLSKAGAAFGAAAGTVTEIAHGWYKVALTTADTGTAGDLAYNCTAASGGDPTDFADQVGQQALFFKKNTALAGFTFAMTDANDVPLTGLTVSAARSLDGGAFASCTNAVAEIAYGLYKIDLSAADLNANVVALRFTAAGAADQDFTIMT